MRQTVSLFIVVFLLFFGESRAQPDNSKQTQGKKRVIAYLHGWEADWGSHFEKAKMITHINFAFANIVDGKVVLGNADDARSLKKLDNLKTINPQLKILISVGGWSWSGNFSDAVLTVDSREVFANSAIAFMQKYHLDGIDLDWEYPGQAGAGNVFRAEDRENFTEILKLLRGKFDSLGTADKSYLLSIATGANQTYLDHTKLEEAQQYLDFLNIMTYDFYTGGSNTTGHHANLYPSDQDTNESQQSANNAVRLYVNAGVPAEKITLGVPFYGRWWTGVNPQNNGRYQTSGGERGSLNYKAITDSLKRKHWKGQWDKAAKAPYIWRERDSLFLTYENERSLKIKSDYVKNNNLGGIMFWELNGDTGSLLETIYQELQEESN